MAWVAKFTQQHEVSTLSDYLEGQQAGVLWELKVLGGLGVRDLGQSI